MDLVDVVDQSSASFRSRLLVPDDQSRPSVDVEPVGVLVGRRTP